MQIVCPHCQSLVELAEVTAGAEVVCRACGSTFRLAGGSTTNWSQRQIGRFEVLGNLGGGAFGLVYKARDPAMDRLVAIKVPRAGSVAGPEEVERFLREARSAAQLRHPSIVTTHEIGTADGVPFLVSEFVEGVTLADYLSGKRPTAREAARLVAEAAEALHHAHGRGVVHRDVKPSNLMLVTDAGGEAHVRVMDFGLARRDAGEVTMTAEGNVLGTPAYMPPEQARGEGHSVDGRSDVYSLGVILYQLLTGELPFRGNARMLLHQVLHDEPKPPRALNDRLPRNLETVCLKAMAKEPGRRYATAKELADDLGRWLHGEPILARPVGRVERAWRWCRRNPAGASLLLVSTLAAAAVGGLLVSHGYGRRLEAAYQAEKDAKEEAERASGVEAAQREKADQALGQARLAQQAEREARKREQEATARARTQHYFHRVALANLELQAKNLVRAGEILDDCPPPLRGWEWGYLNRLCRVHRHTLRGHAGLVWSVAFSPEGARLASVGADRSVRMWDAVGGRQLWEKRVHAAAVRGLSFSKDGRRLATASYDGTVRLWEAATGGVERVLSGHTGNVISVAIRADGRQVAAGGADKTVLVWDADTGERVRTLGPFGTSISCVEYSPGGAYLAYGGGATIELSDVKTGKAVRELRGHRSFVWRVAFSPDEKRLASASEDGTAIVWDVESGKALLTLEGHVKGVKAVAFSPDARRLATAGEDMTIRLWDAQAGREELALTGHKNCVSSLSFSEDGRALASSAFDATAMIWDTSPDRGPRAIPRNSAASYPLAPLGIAKGPRPFDRDQLTKLWDGVTGVGAYMFVQVSGVSYNVAFSPNGRHLAAGTLDKSVRAWDAATGRSVAEFTGATDVVTAVAYSPKGTRLAAAGRDEGLRVWDASTGRLAWEVKGQSSQVPGLAFAPDGGWLASCCPKTGVKLWDVATGREARHLSSTGTAHSIAVSPDGNKLVAAYRLAGAEIIDLAGGNRRLLPGVAFEPAEDAGHAGQVNAVAFSPDGRLLVTAGQDKTVRVWDPGEAKVVRVLRGHAGQVYAVAFSPDGRRLASGGHDRSVKLWDVATGAELMTISAGKAPVAGLAFSPDGRRLAAAGGDQILRVWESAPFLASVADQPAP